MRRSAPLVLPRLGSDVIIDACCGTGRSTLRLAELEPTKTVVGVDRSADRLSRRGGAEAPENALLIRAELGDFWRLLAESDVRVSETFVLYPNPYPKTAHLKKRWQGHACLPSLLASAGDRLTLRASWRTYLDEFLLAVRVAADCGDENAARLLATGDASSSRLDLDDAASALTNFEAKYITAGVPLYELRLGA